MRAPFRRVVPALFSLAAACGGPGPEAGGGGGGAETGGGEAPPAPARLPETVVPTHYALTLTIDPAQTTFSGDATIDVRLSEPTTRIWLHGQALSVSAVTVEAGGAAMAAQWQVSDPDEGTASVVTASPVPAGEARIHVVYTAPFDETLEGLYRVDVGEDRYAFTQFEALAARKAFPCFDEPRFKTPYDVTLISPEANGAFANSLETEVATDAAGLTTHRFATTEALPTYLVAWAVGPLDVVTATIPPNAIRSTPLPFRGLAPRGRGPEMAYAMEHTPRIVEALETWFGIPYPFDKLDIVAVPDFAAGAMENAGLVTFRDVLLLLDESAPMSQRRGFAFVMAHELAHQWFGNLVTMAWWDDLWLNEGFASWMETAIVEATFPELQAGTTELMTELDAFDADALATARQIRQPIESRHDISNAFDSITYSKGASVIMTLSRWLGADVFQRGIRRYLADHARGSATTEDLVAALSAESGRDVRPVLDDLTLRPGIPLLATALTCDEGAAPSVTFTQSRYLPLGSTASAEGFWHVPVCVRWSAAGTTHTTCTLLEESSSTLSLEGTVCPDWILPNADGGSYLRFTLPEAQLTALRAAMAPPAAPAGRGRRRAPATTPVAPALTVRDQITLADSVRAGFRAGRIPFAAAMEVLAPMANSTERFVATAPIELLVTARDHYLEDSHDAAFQTYAHELYAAQLTRLGWSGPDTEEGEVRLLRAAILGFLALTAEDPDVRREARTRGEAYVAGGAIHPEAVGADYTSVALSVAAQEGGTAAFEQLVALLAGTEDAAVRSYLVAAISSIDDDDLRPRVLGLSLDERLRLNESYRPLSAQLGDPDGRELGWMWLTEHYDALRERMGPEYAGYLPFVAAGFCSAERAAEVRAFFEPRMAETNGGPRNLASAIETIELCAALAASQAEGARTFFASRGE